jgi:hypothetical protein
MGASWSRARYARQELRLFGCLIVWLSADVCACASSALSWCMIYRSAGYVHTSATRHWQSQLHTSASWLSRVVTNGVCLLQIISDDTLAGFKKRNPSDGEGSLSDGGPDGRPHFMRPTSAGAGRVASPVNSRSTR